MNKTIFLPAVLFAAILLLAGCTIMAPKYTPPTAPVAEQWPTGPAYRGPQPATDQPTATEADWQAFFADDRLRQIIQLALANNRDLRLASLKVDMARALYGIQRAELYPTVYATGSGGRQRAAADLTADGQPQNTEQYSVNLGVLAWEVDFFGRLRSLKNEALESYLASEQARHAAQILLLSSVANAYLALAADREALALAERTLDSQQATCELVQRQHQFDLATELDLRQAQIPVEVARRNLAIYIQQVAQDINALHLLVGSPLPDHLLPDELGQISPFADISPGLSSEILVGRPDIMAAEHRLKGAHAVIGAARAAFFPRIALTTTLGTASHQLAGLFKSGTDTWSYAPQIVMPIFDARTWSAYRASKVQREIAVAEYERAIQGAFREVADTLATRGTIDRQLAAQQALVDALDDTQRLALSRFEAGIDSYLGVLDAQRSLFGAQQHLVALRRIQRSSQVQLYAALGGGGNQQ